MCLLSLAVGLIAGLGAWVLRMLIGLFHNLFFLGQLQFAYDANRHTSVNPWGAGIILAPVIGAIIVAWIVKTFAPEAKGHGVPEVTIPMMPMLCAAMYWSHPMNRCCQHCAKCRWFRHQ